MSAAVVRTRLSAREGRPLLTRRSLQQEEQHEPRKFSSNALVELVEKKSSQKDERLSVQCAGETMPWLQEKGTDWARKGKRRRGLKVAKTGKKEEGEVLQRCEGERDEGREREPARACAFL